MLFWNWIFNWIYNGIHKIVRCLMWKKQKYFKSFTWFCDTDKAHQNRVKWIFLCEVFGCSFHKGKSSLWSNNWHISQVLCKQRCTMALWWPFLISILYELLVHYQLSGEVVNKELCFIRSEFSFFSTQWCQGSLKVKVKSLSCVWLLVTHGL